MEQQQNWRKLDGTRIKHSLEDEVRMVIVREKEAGHQLKVCIGTDSQVKGKETEFATVIVFTMKFLLRRTLVRSGNLLGRRE